MMTWRALLGSASGKRYVRGGSVAPGTCTGALKVRNVRLFHSSARAIGARHATIAAVQHIAFITRMSIASIKGPPSVVHVVCPSPRRADKRLRPDSDSETCVAI